MHLCKILTSYFDFVGFCWIFKWNVSTLQLFKICEIFKLMFQLHNNKHVELENQLKIEHSNIKIIDLRKELEPRF